MTEVIKGLHGVDVNADALLAEQSDKLRISSATLMSRDIKGNDALFAESFKRLVNGGAHLLFQVHRSFDRSFFYADSAGQFAAIADKEKKHPARSHRTKGGAENTAEKQAIPIAVCFQILILYYITAAADCQVIPKKNPQACIFCDFVL